MSKMDSEKCLRTYSQIQVILMNANNGSVYPESEWLIYAGINAINRGTKSALGVPTAKATRQATNIVSEDSSMLNSFIPIIPCCDAGLEIRTKKGFAQ